MKKLSMILPLALILCFMVGCQDKEAMAELEKFRAQAEAEEQNIRMFVCGYGENYDGIAARKKTKFLSCAMKSCMADGGRPSGDGLQEWSPNCPELHV